MDLIPSLLQQLEDNIVQRQTWLEENNMDNSQEMIDLDDALGLLVVLERLTTGNMR